MDGVTHALPKTNMVGDQFHVRTSCGLAGMWRDGMQLRYDGIPTCLLCATARLQEEP